MSLRTDRRKVTADRKGPDQIAVWILLGERSTGRALDLKPHLQSIVPDGLLVATSCSGGWPL